MSLITLSFPLWTVILRKTNCIAAPSLANVDGPVIPIFTREDYADQSTEEHAGLDPYRIDTVDKLREILKGVAESGGTWVAIDGGVVGNGRLFSIADLVRSI